MLVCHCKGVSEREVKSVIAGGACTPRAVARECGAGTVCGGCRPVIDELLDAHTTAAPGTPSLGFELAAAS